MGKMRGGMTLFELLVVMTIVGIVYSIGIFTLSKEKATASTMSLMTLKSTLGAFSQSGKTRIVCDLSCRECRVWSADETPLATVHLKSEKSIERYGFDRFGELKKLGAALTRTEGALRQACFEYTLYPDGTATPLILKSDNKYYAYTPLGGEKPYVAGSDEALRRFIFNESNYPLRGDDYYADR